MSNTDAFIEEVTEEVRRDRLFALMRRYGWIAVLAVVLLVGGAAFLELQKSRATKEARLLGDEMLAALAQEDLASRSEAFQKIEASTAGADAVLQYMKSAALANTDQPEAAVAGLSEVASNGDLPEIYRQIAQFKLLLIQRGTLDPADLRQQWEALAQPGVLLRPLAEEQLALLEIDAGETDAAIARLQALVQDVEASTELKQRAVQVIVALGGTPDLGALENG